MKPIDYRLCRIHGAGWRPIPGTQLELRSKVSPPIPLNGLCFDCDRHAIMYVRRDGKLVGYCTWHIGKRLPMTVRRSSFHSLKVSVA